MADIKISELSETTDLNGLYTIGTDKNNLSKKVALQFVKDAADYANTQGDYAKQVGDTVSGNVGVSDYPEFSASTSYVIGDVVRYNGVLYAFTANHAASAWNGSDVKATSINAITSGKLTELESETEDKLANLNSKIQKDIADIKPIVINGDVNNAADEEDITSAKGLLKLKDRDDALGMGYVILRKDKSFAEQVTKANTIYEIRYDFDLRNEEIIMPKSCVLGFQGGTLSNGIIKADDTKINGSIYNIFRNVTFAGVWLVENINSQMFVSYNGYELLQAISSLLNSECYNNVVLNGTINIDFPKNISNGLTLKSNTDIQISGKIVVNPNNFTHYRVFYLENVSNVNIDGGVIMGDVESHLGTDGEFGVGISIASSKMISITNTKIVNMWGDGIYIGRANYDSPTDIVKSENINISNVSCSLNRRQGISLTCCSKVNINACTFFGTGTIQNVEPGYGVDIEPNNEYDEIFDVTVSNSIFADNFSGSLDRSILIYAPHHNVRNIRIHNNILSGRISITGLRNSVINSNRFSAFVIGEIEDNNNVYLLDNIINEDENLQITNKIISKGNKWASSPSGTVDFVMTTAVTKISVPKFNGMMNFSIINRSVAPGTVFLDKSVDIKMNYNNGKYGKGNVRYLYGSDTNKSSVGEEQLMYSIKVSEGIEEGGNIVFYLYNPRDSYMDLLSISFRQLWSAGFNKISYKDITIENLSAKPDNIDGLFLEAISQPVIARTRIVNQYCDLKIGTCIFDWSYMQPLWWNGSKWINGVGEEL